MKEIDLSDVCQLIAKTIIEFDATSDEPVETLAQKAMYGATVAIAWEMMKTFYPLPSSFITDWLVVGFKASGLSYGLADQEAFVADVLGVHLADALALANTKEAAT